MGLTYHDKINTQLIYRSGSVEENKTKKKLVKVRISLAALFYSVFFLFSRGSDFISLFMSYFSFIYFCYYFLYSNPFNMFNAFV